MSNDDKIDGNFFESLPEGFLANALGRTSPRDVCALSLLSSVFRSAAEWDAVWEKFLPPDYHSILAASDGGSSTADSKKELYLCLCDYPLIIDGGNKSFWLHKSSGKKCYMLDSRDLSSIWGDNPRVCLLELRGRIDASLLSTNTGYVAYLVYRTTPKTNGYECPPAEVSVRFSGGETQTKLVILDPEMRRRQRYEYGPNRRPDGWLEIKLGELYNEEGQQGEVDMVMRNIKVNRRNRRGGLIVQGIEIRPKV